MKITSQSGQHGVDRPITARQPEHEIYDLMHDLAATGSLPPALLPHHEEAKERVLDVSDMGTQVDVDDFRPMDFEQQMSAYVDTLKNLLVANGLTYVLNDLEDSWLRRAT